jgi:hypothetical protein
MLMFFSCLINQVLFLREESVRERRMSTWRENGGAGWLLLERQVFDKAVTIAKRGHFRAFFI